MHQKITVPISISIAASDSESHAISADWKSSDFHIDFTSEINMIIFITGSEVLLLLEYSKESSVQLLFQCSQRRHLHASVEDDSL